MDDEEKWEDLGIKAQDLARLGRIDEALQLISEIPPPQRFTAWSHEKTMALIAIAVKLSERGQNEQTISVTNEAVRCCEALHEGAIWEEADCYEKIASIQNKLNMRSEALSLWKKSVAAAQLHQSVDIDCVKILAKIARDLADIGEVQLAGDVASSIVLDEIRDKTLAYVKGEDRGKRKGIWT